MEIFVFPYKAGSKSAIAISDALDCFRINRDGSSRFTYSPNKAVINWGFGGSLPEQVARCKVINKPEAICRSVDKISSFEAFIANRVLCPEYTRDRSTALQWRNQGHNVYCRGDSGGRDGSGLVVSRARSSETLPSAAFYTKGLTITNEYRLNVVGDEVITYQKKVKVSGREDHDLLVRTTNGGWGFEVVEDERNIPANIDEEAIAAVKAVGLDFAGVDIIDSRGTAYVVEVNTAPHLTPYSARKMAQALKEYIG